MNERLSGSQVLGQCLLTVGQQIQAPAFALDGPAEAQAQGGVVFNLQDAHAVRGAALGPPGGW